MGRHGHVRTPGAEAGGGGNRVRPISDEVTILEQSLNSEVHHGSQGAIRSLTEDPKG